MTRHGVTRLLIVLLVVAGLLVLADSLAKVYAEHRASAFLAVHAPFERDPTITVHGTPFLTQAFSGTYHDVEVRGGGLNLGDVQGATLDAHLRGVHLALGDLFGKRVTRLPVDRIDGSLLLPYSEVARLSQVPDLVLRRAGNGITASATLSVPGLGSPARVTGTGDVQLTDGKLRLHVSQLSVSGVSVPGSLLEQLEQMLDTTIPLPALPYGLRLDRLSVADKGVLVHGSTGRVVLKAL